MKKYIYIIVSLFIAGVLIQSAFEQVNKKSAKSARIECHKKTVVFEKLLAPKLLTSLKSEIKSGNFSLNIDEKKAIYMSSKLFDFVDSKKLKEEFSKLLNQKENLNAKASIDLTIFENDKKDPSKKSEKSKLFPGYLLLDFKFENRLVYKIQIDFKDEKGKDISKILECVKSSLETL